MKWCTILVFGMLTTAYAQTALGDQTRKTSTDDFCRAMAGKSHIAIGKADSTKSPDLKFTLSSENLQFCSYSGEDANAISQGWAKKNVVSAYQAQRQFKDTVELIQAYSRIKAKFGVMFATIPNAMAVLQKKGNEIDRYVLYNWKYLCGVQDYTGSKWADDSVFAHEVGHHLPNHTLEGGSRPYFELQADWFSGYILQRMGAPQDEATIVLSKMFEHQLSSREKQSSASLTHPLTEDRIAAVAEGWSAACESDPKCELLQP